MSSRSSAAQGVLVRKPIAIHKLPFIHEFPETIEPVDIHLLCSPLSSTGGSGDRMQTILEHLKITKHGARFANIDEFVPQVKMWIKRLSVKEATSPGMMKFKKEILARLSHLSLTDHLLLHDMLVALRNWDENHTKSYQAYLISAGRKLTRWTLTLPSSMIYNGIGRKSEEKDPYTEGGFGDLYHESRSGIELGVKVIRAYETTSQKGWQMTFEEAWAWKEVSQNNKILPLLGVSVTYFRRRLSLVSPWCSLGNVRDYLNKYQQRDRLRYIVDITEGIAFLHSKKYVHGDIKAANILVDKEGHIQIADMGLTTASLSARLESTTRSDFAGTVQWLAPELLVVPEDVTSFSTQTRKREHNYRTDVYAWSVTVYEVITLKVPYQNWTERQLINEIVNNKRRLELPRDNEYFNNVQTGAENPTELWKIINEAWSHEPSERPLMDMLLGKLRALRGSKRRDDDHRERIPHKRPRVK